MPTPTPATRLSALALSACLLSACGASFVPITPIDAKPGSFTFGASEKVGAKTRRSMTYRFDVSVIVAAGSRSVSRHVTAKGHTRRVEEIIELDKSGHAAKLRVAYEDDTIVWTGDIDKTAVAPTVSKTYLVTMSSAGAKVTRDDGSEAPEKEAKSVAGDFPWLEENLLAVREKSFVVGERVASDIMPFFVRDAKVAGASVSSASAIYRGLHGSEGVFDVDVKFSRSTSLDDKGPTGTADVTFSTRGQIGFTADDRSGEFTGSGSLTVRVASGSASIECSGPFEASGRWDPL